MLFTAATIIGFALFAIIALVIGHFTEHIEIYFLGVVVLLVLGLFIIGNGIAEQVGVTRDFNETVTGNLTERVEVSTFVFDNNQNRFSNALGLLFIVIAAGLTLTWKRGKDARRLKAERSIDDLDEDF